MTAPPSILVTVAGQDAPGIAARVFEGLSTAGLPVADVEQVQVHGHLLLCVEVEGEGDRAEDLRRAVVGALGVAGTGLVVTAVPLREVGRPTAETQLVTVLAPDLPSGVLGSIFGRVASAGGNVERIARLSRFPVVSYELEVSGADAAGLRRGLAEEAARSRVDVAVQRTGLHRRAKHLIVLDVDSTLLQGEVIDLLAARTGHAEEVAAVTAAAMAGEIDFADALHRRVGLLGGLDESVLAEVRCQLTLAPGARTLVRTLRRLGYVTAIVSGGFVQVIDELADDLGIDHVAANQLEVVDGRLTGRLVGPVIDRAGKAAALVDFARRAGVPLGRTIAVGDGANDLDMLAVAGLGIAFNAKPVVRDAADTSLSVPYLDAILFLLGISREEVEAADREDAD